MLMQTYGIQGCFCISSIQVWPLHIAYSEATHTAICLLLQSWYWSRSSLCVCVCVCICGEYSYVVYVMSVCAAYVWACVVCVACIYMWCMRHAFIYLWCIGVHTFLHVCVIWKSMVLGDTHRLKVMNHYLKISSHFIQNSRGIPEMAHC